MGSNNGEAGEALHENWHSIEQASEALADKIEDYCDTTGERFDKVVLVVRGAYGPGNIVSRRLGFSAADILHACVESRRRDRSQGDFIYGQMPLPQEVTGLDLLMLDEVGDSNATAKHVKALLELAGARTVKCGVLHDKTDATFDEHADFEWDWVGAPLVRGDTWIHYPWEKHDDAGDVSVVNRRLGRAGSSAQVSA